MIRRPITALGSPRDALRHADFRRLFSMRLVSQSADGLVQAALVASLAFSPERSTTAAGFALASAIVIVPFSLIGPFVGVFIDRWSRRRIMVIAPLLRAAPVFLVLANPSRQAALYYGGALFVTSVNRFFLATAQAVVPRLVPTEDLLAANSIATVGGTVALLVGVFTGGLVSDAFGNGAIVTVAAVMWVTASFVARRIRSDLRPHQLPESPELLRHQLRRVGVEFADGLRHIVHTPRAVGPIASIGLDQMGQGLILVLALVVFRERFDQGVGSFSWLIGAGGVGVFSGLATVGALDRRFERERIVAGAFAVGGAGILLVSLVVTPWTVLLASFVVGLSFAWKKVPVDTMVQEAVPDGLRGRVFAAYDVVYNAARLLAAVLAIPLLPALGEQGTAALIGVVFLLWVPVLPRWLAHAPEIRLRFAEGARAEEWPRTVVWGGVEEPVEVVRSSLDEHDGVRTRRFRLTLADGTVIDVSRDEPDGQWRIDRELAE
ncbi:MAG: MFS transporter [Acidimicrobiia bacterium]